MLKVDRRVRKSQEAIKMAVIELMNEKDFDQITIQDISDRADVSRRTIYLHYTDKFNLLDKLIGEHITNLREICEATEDDDSYRDMVEMWFEYFENHSLFFSALLASKGSSFFRNQFLVFFIEELGKGNSMSEEGNIAAKTEGINVEVQFLGAAIVGVVEWWFKKEKPLPRYVMAERIGALLERNLDVDS
ncbi:TetR/AcrR family transcriptional regulator [Paenibacillus sp. FSL R5-0766]|uniref:TetR/AcrR family transcriptional regulator n=1 Tax=unclassified Paenibacillus TaxID=185978 RepID=UPI00096FFAF9|nr:TetR/AcrR family transcriptional regulator [Paenibacillus sp. FSL R5-0765]OMF67997.1 TetR family transcriptional regulator [Paenibacillus sp. FSL R5-0765]